MTDSKLTEKDHEKLAIARNERLNKADYARDLIMIARVASLAQKVPGMTEELAIQYVGLSIAQQANDK